jgi:hypothetical protein
VRVAIIALLLGLAAATSAQTAPVGARFMIITSDALAQPLQLLVLHKNATGMPTEMHTVSEIRTYYFPGARDDAEAVKRMIERGATNGVKYFMLAGDGSHVPVRYRYVQNPNPIGSSYNPSDLYYANLYRGHKADGSHLVGPGAFEDWDLNGNGLFDEELWSDGTAATHNPDGVDGYPDVAVGRVPAATATEMSIFVNKVIQYELAAWTPAASRAGFFIDRNYAGAPDFATQIANALPSPDAVKDYFGLSYQSMETVPWPFARGTPQNILDETSLAGLMFYVGHGWDRGWLYDSSFPASLVDGLTNTTNYPIVFAAGCNTGEFATWLCAIAHDGCPGVAPASGPPSYSPGHTSLASDWLFYANRAGAIAYVGEVWTAEDVWGAKLAEYMAREYEKRVGLQILGDIWRNAQISYWKAPPSITLPDGRIQAGIDNVLGAPRIFLGFSTFFGDPSLRLKPAPTTVGVFRPGNTSLNSTGADQWLMRRSNTGGNPDVAFSFGAPGDVPVVGDWTGSGRIGIGVYRPPNTAYNPTSSGQWLLRNSSTPGAPDISFSYGGPGDVPVVGDWTGSGRTTIGVYRPAGSPLNASTTAQWFLRNSNSGGTPDVTISYGGPGDLPVVGDWAASGRTTIGVYRPAGSPLNAFTTAQWFLRNSNSGGTPDISISYGGPGDVPVVGRWNGGLTTTIGVYRPAQSTLNPGPISQWLLRYSNTPGSADLVFYYGGSSDLPAVGPWGKI